MNIKIKKKILVCMLWLCAIACFTEESKGKCNISENV